ncbi:MAG TPA: hypothetical protein VHE30_02795 [Polyangiaceae bacterium]|nr:hypothetical protein [Polyangiaceae bacterium]
MQNEAHGISRSSGFSRRVRAVPRGFLGRALGSLSVSVAALALFGACSSTSREPGTGETHFLANCTTSCPDGLECICGACTKTCGSDGACSAFPGGATCETNACGGGSSCDVACSGDGDCAALPSASHCVSGKCRATAETGDGGTSHPDAGGSSHDFDHCARKPPSVCTMQETCAELGCGGLEFESDGCMRAPCTDDGACGDAERCAATRCVNTSACTYQSGGECGCGGTAQCIAGAFCNPVAAVGKKGDFVSIEVQVGSGPCPPGNTCSSWWKITADGGLAAMKSGEPISSQISAGDLAEITYLVNGPELRNALEKGIACDQPPTDVGETIILTLSSGELQRDVTGCVFSGPSGNVFQQVDAIVKRY